MSFQIPKSNFDPHPTGRHQGKILEVRDKGMVATQWGEKHKVAVVIESQTAMMDDGRPFLIFKSMTLSSDKKSALRAFREAVLDRPLTADEMTDFSPNRELIGRAISYRVDHSEPGPDGSVFANIRDGSVEPVGSTQQNRTAVAASSLPANGRSATGARGGVAVAEPPAMGEVPPPGDEELPF